MLNISISLLFEERLWSPGQANTNIGSEATPLREPDGQAVVMVVMARVVGLVHANISAQTA